MNNNSNLNVISFPLTTYNPLCSLCIKCTSCNINTKDTKKMHFIYDSIQKGYIVGLEKKPDEYSFRIGNKNLVSPNISSPNISSSNSLNSLFKRSVSI